MDLITISALVLVCNPDTNTCEPPFEFKSDMPYNLILNEDKSLNCDAFAIKAIDTIKIKYPKMKIFLSGCNIPDMVPLGPKEVPVVPK